MTDLVIPQRVSESMSSLCALIMLMADLGKRGWMGGYGSGAKV